MKRLIGLILATALSLSLRAATAPLNPPEPQCVRLPSVVTNINGVDVINHLVIGPFPVRPGEDMTKIDYMKKAGLGEDIAGAAEFAQKLKGLGIRAGADEVYPQWIGMNERRQFVDFNYVFNQPESKATSGAVTYVAFTIKSDKKMSARMLIGCTGAPRVFVNGKSVLSIKGKRRLLIYGEAPRIPLVPGDNLGPVNIIAKLGMKCRDGEMELTEAHLERIRESLPVERGNVSMEVLNFLNAVLYVMENGCKWRRLPERFGNWHTIYTRMNRWSKNGVWDRLFARLQEEGVLAVELKVVSLDSTSVKVHPDGTGAEKKTGRRPSASPAAAGTPRSIWLPRMMSAPSVSGFRPARTETAPKAAS